MPPSSAASSTQHNSVSARLCSQYGLKIDNSAIKTAEDAVAGIYATDGENNENNAATAATTVGGNDGINNNNNFLPPFIEGKSLKEAVRECNAATKYCLVYLHAGDHEDASHFVTSVLSQSAVVSKIRDLAICYFVDAYSAEGVELEHKWSVDQFPYCSLLIKGRVVGDLQGRFTADDFLDFLEQCDDVARPIVHQEAAFVFERNMRERLRAQQEAEMAEAEQQDRERLAAARKAESDRKEAEKERVRLEAQQRREAEERAEAERIAEIERIRREEEERRIAEEAALQLETVKATAASALSEEPPETTEAALVAKVRLVDLKGRPNNRSFYRSDLVRALFTYAQTIEGYDGKPFALMAGFPPRAIDESTADTVTIGEVPSLVPRSVVTMKSL